MSTSVELIFVVLVALAYLVAPTTLIWGWVRWSRPPKLRSLPAIVSLAGFAFATASALLAVFSAVFARFHYFQFYDPVLMKIFRFGILLSLAGIAFGIGGVWRSNSLRWHAPVSGFATLAFWIIAVEGE